jgi:hypothetical protein
MGAVALFITLPLESAADFCGNLPALRRSPWPHIVQGAAAGDGTSALLDFKGICLDQLIHGSSSSSKKSIAAAMLTTQYSRADTGDILGSLSIPHFLALRRRSGTLIIAMDKQNYNVGQDAKGTLPAIPSNAAGTALLLCISYACVAYTADW